MDRQENIVTSKINWNIVNWMRGLAALYVVINHSRGNLFTDTAHYAANVTPQAQWHWWEKLSFIIMQHTNLGTEAVIVFFLLSGFSIAHSLSGTQKAAPFYIRRAIRLYPPYILGLLWAIVVFLVIKVDGATVFFNTTEGHEPLKILYEHFISLKSVISNILYVPRDNSLTPQYWSLPFEVVFYLLAPWAVRYIKPYGLLTILCYTGGWMWMGMTYYDDEKDPILLQFITDYNIYFLIGILFYQYRETILQYYKLSKRIAFTILIVLFELTIIVKSYLFHQQSNKITGLLMILFTYIMLFAGLKYSIRISWLEFIGVFSYTLYVTHFATIYLVKMIFFDFGKHFYDIYQLYAWYIGIIVSLVIAYGLYYIAEYPGIKYLEKIRKKPNYAG